MEVQAENLPKDVPCHGKGYPGHPDQAGRPSSQYAYAAVSVKPEKQKEKARETMDIYAPIAHRLGISKIKVELDDLSLKYLEPEVYYDLVEKIALKKDATSGSSSMSIVKEVSEHIEARPELRRRSTDG